MRADVSAAEEAAFTTSPTSCRLLTGVMHAGAVLDSAVISNINLSGLRTEFGGKVVGAEALLDRTTAAPLVTLNLFSSLAAFSGSGGQRVYAAANGTLDAHAASLQARHTAKLHLWQSRSTRVYSNP